MRWKVNRCPIALLRHQIVRLLALSAAWHVAVLAAQERESVFRDQDVFNVEVTDPWFPSNVADQGLNPVGAWVPASVALRSRTGRDETVVLELRIEPASNSGDDNAKSFIVRRPVEVGAGAPKRVWLNGRVAAGSRQIVRVTARSGGKEVFVQEVGTADTMDIGERLLTALFVGKNLMRHVPDPNWFRSRNTLQPGLIVDACEPSRLPDTLLGYQPFDFVIVRSLAGERLEPAQLRALKHWVFLGGILILAPSTDTADLLQSVVAAEVLGASYTEPLSKPLERLEQIIVGAKTELHGIDETMTEAIRRNRTEFLEATERLVVKKETMDLVADVKCVLFDPIVGPVRRRISSIAVPKEEVAAPFSTGRRSTGRGDTEGAEAETFDLEPGGSPRGDRLYGELSFGDGRIGVVTFNDSVYTGRALASGGVQFLRPFWREILFGEGHPPRNNLSARSAVFARTPVVNQLKDPSRDIGFPFIVFLVLFYIVLVGPGLYFSLKRLGLLHWLIWVQPVLVCLYLGVVLLAGYLSKGVITKARQWTVVSHNVGDELARKENYLAVFSGAKRGYTIGAPQGVVLHPIYPNKESIQPVVVEEKADGARQILDLQLDQWQEGYAVNFDMMDIDPGGLNVTVLEEPDRNASDSSETISAPGGQGRTEVRLRVRIENHLPYKVLSGVFHHARGVDYVIPEVAAGATEDHELRPVGPNSEEPPLPDGWLELCRIVGSEGLTLPRRGRRVLAAKLDRGDADFDAEWSGNLRERLDLYLMYGN